MEPIWTPSARRVQRAAMTRFTDELKTRGLRFDGYEDLWRWSVSEREEFWSGVWDFCGVVAEKKGDRVLEDREVMPGARWFPDARLNYAENLLRHRGEEPAIFFFGEGADPRTISRDELVALTARIAAGLSRAGVEEGDRVAGFLPNLPEAVAAMLATSSLGAVWSSCSPDFGVSGVLDRFGQIEPKVLLTADGYRYGGKTYDSLDKAFEIAAALPSVRCVVVVPYLSESPSLPRDRDAVSIDDLPPSVAGDLSFARLPFDHPVYVLYSSGTTGAPKCIIHGAGGTLLQHFKEHVLHTDLAVGKRILYYTTTGWMMWNWLAGSLASGAAVVLYDGSPFFPDPEALFRVVESAGVNVFGTSARYLAALEKAGARPGRNHDLSRMETVLSTGSPLSVESFHYVYEHVKEDVCLSSISGGTDIVSCFALGNPTLPVRPGELQCRGLGMDVHAFDSSGAEVVGRKGELVCAAPFPSMPIGFVGDPDGRRYRSAYFERYPGVWHHGDFVTITESGGVVVHGRSDATLNPGGVRIGTAEIYRQVNAFPEVVDSLAVGVPEGEDEKIVLFVKMAEGAALTPGLESGIRERIRKRLSPRHVPARILPAPDIPYTRSGKKVEIAVRRLLAGESVKNREALANPEALDELARIARTDEG